LKPELSVVNGVMGTNTAGVDSKPRVAFVENNTWLVVYSSTWVGMNGELGVDYDIMYAVTEDNGLSWSTPLPLNDYAMTDYEEDYGPTISSDMKEYNSTLVAMWWSKQPSSTDFDIVWSRSPDSGRTWTPAKLLLPSIFSSDSDTDQTPFVETDRKGVWVCVFASYNATIVSGVNTGTDCDVFASYSVDNGLTWSGASLVNSGGKTDGASATSNNIDSNPSLATDRKGIWVTVWKCYGGVDTDICSCTALSARSRKYAISDSYIRYVAFSSNNGKTWSTSNFVNSYYNGDTLNEGEPSIAGSAAGVFIVVWRSQDSAMGSSELSDPEIAVAISTTNGCTLPPCSLFRRC